MNFTVGICAYNEEKNIANLLNAILKQKKLADFSLDEIIVVSSGSTDQTNQIIEQKQKTEPRIKLLIQKEREGKNSAVNLILKNAKNYYLIFESADTLPDPEAYSKILNALKERNVGLVAARIIPQDDPKTFMGFCTHLLWNLHHRICLQFPQRPKVGEMAAFKKIFKKIPRSSVLDEASVEPLIHLQGYKVIYCPEAIIYNKGPETIKDFLRQRRRNYLGHTVIKKKYGYSVVTYSNFRIFGTLLANIEWSNWRFFIFTPAIIILEALARLIALIDYYFKTRSHIVWEIAKSTKKLKSI
jgi:glycosyltransferase involved in cell wall biosynthesis